VNGAFFLAVSAYCFLAFTPFAYDAFINPSVVPALWGVFAVSPSLFWAMLLVTTLTLMPQLRTRGARGRVLAWSYVGAGAVAGVAIVVRPMLSNIGNTPKAMVLGMASLLWPVWLSVVDHCIWPAPTMDRADAGRVLRASLLAAVIAWATYAIAALTRASQTVGLDLPFRVLAGAIGSSFVLTLFVFMALFLAVLTATRLPRLARMATAAEYWLLILLLGVCSGIVVHVLVSASLAFTGPLSVMTATAMAATIAALWADVARLRGQPPKTAPPTAEPSAIDAVALFGAPVAGVRGPRKAVVTLVVLPVIAYAMVAAVRQFDWNFLLQKLSVLIVWLVAFVCAYAVVGRPRARWSSPIWLAGAPAVAFGLYHLLAGINPWMVIDRYSAIDPSVRLIRDARTAQSAATAENYEFLRSQTLLMPPLLGSPTIDFVRPLQPAPGRRPNIFLLVIDSLRRDYLSPYNSEVHFTPEIDKLAADSFVYERAWTRYSGTLLSVPAIWAGGMVPHMVRQTAFRRRNTLLKLLEANDYARLMDIDSVVETLDVRDDHLVELNVNASRFSVDFCTTVKELEHKLPRDRSHPTFVYSLPQNVHPGGWRRRDVPAGEHYPPMFTDRVASSVRHVDACVGQLVALLKRERLYDDSVIILTADHGDLLGEEGRWGHAFWLYPEVMKIPLIMHLPSWLKATVRTDLDAVVFTTDITPSLYALLGYHPQDLGPLFGRSFFTPRDGDSSERRRQSWLVASSYGAVYGIVSRNGRRMDVVDTVDAAEYSLDLGAGHRRRTVTPLMMAQTRRAIAEQLRELATLYHYTDDAP
jgi:hypothetical protein